VVSQNRGSSALAMTRGEVWLAALDSPIGGEIQKTRPCLIVSLPERRSLPTIIAAPMTTGSRPAPSHRQGNGAGDGFARHRLLFSYGNSFDGRCRLFERS
jgi:hypothetical protein